MNGVLGAVYTISSTGTYNNIDPSGANFIRANSGNGTITINGIVAPSSGSQQILVWNAGTTGTVVLQNEQAGSTAANRLSVSRTTVTIAPGRVARLTYRTSDSRWAVDYQDWVQVDAYTTPGSYTWNRPANARMHEIIVIAGGGGGGSGRRGAAGSVRCGGGGGGGGGSTWMQVGPALLAATGTVVVGSGGAGGLGQTVNNSDGNAGTPGNNSSFASGLLGLSRIGGLPGSGGTASSGTGGGQRISWPAGTSGAGANASVTGGAGSAASGNANSPGGGSGGGIPTGNTFSVGGGGGANLRTTNNATLGGSTDGAAGASGSTLTTDFYWSGNGGAGGASSVLGAGGAGGAGGLGCGGGGGGASINDVGTSGAGGNGGDGAVFIISWF